MRQIDANRWYTNFGPLVNKFLSRTAQLFSTPFDHVVCGATGTQLLEICLKALGVKPRSFCVMSSWTFVATPLAAVSAGLEPLFVDVELDTQTIDPVKLLQDLPRLLQQGPISAVLVTAPFGRPVDTLAWDEFTELSGIPVIIDGAAAFDSLLQNTEMCIGRTPIMVSLHATKVFGVGEGGLLFSSNQDLLSRIQNMTQFGFPSGVRNAHYLGTNGKMNEYVAAVGLAALDSWQDTRRAWQDTTACYSYYLKKAGIEHMLSPNWVGSTCNVIIPSSADAVLNELDKQGIATRKWWGDGCHRQLVFQQSHRGSSLRHTEWLQQSVLGLPFYLDMSEEVIVHVVNATTKAVALRAEAIVA